MNANAIPFDSFLAHHSLPRGGLSIQKRKNRDNTYYLYRTSGKKAVAITDFLYLDADVYLARKHQLALDFSGRYQ